MDTRLEKVEVEKIYSVRFGYTFKKGIAKKTSDLALPFPKVD